MATILKQAIEYLDYTFNPVSDFSVELKHGCYITVAYLDYKGNQFIDFMIINKNTTVEEVAKFIENHYKDAEWAEENAEYYYVKNQEDGCFEMVH